MQIRHRFPLRAGRTRSAKRAIDAFIAVIVLGLALPLVALVALAILAESPGPIFYRAQRVGFRGRPLRMLKFRKMRADASGSALTVGDDARFTRVGAILARTRLDELPQLWHVLRGEMSLIGPRPEDPKFVAQRHTDYEEILEVRPGLSGLSQLAFADERWILREGDPVSHYLDQILPQKCALDCLYVRRATVATDARIVLWTLIAVLLRRPVSVHRATGALSRRRPGHGRVAVSRVSVGEGGAAVLSHAQAPR